MSRRKISCAYYVFSVNNRHCCGTPLCVHVADTARWSVYIPLFLFSSEKNEKWQMDVHIPFSIFHSHWKMKITVCTRTLDSLSFSSSSYCWAVRAFYALYRSQCSVYSNDKCRSDLCRYTTESGTFAPILPSYWPWFLEVVVCVSIFNPFYRATLCVSKRCLCCRPRCLSVRPSVRLSRWWIVSTRLKISSNFFLGPVDPSF